MEAPKKPKPDLQMPTSKPLTSKWLWLGTGIVAILIIGGLAFAFQRSAPRKSVTDSGSANSELKLAETGYTGVAADVLTNQTFDCQARNEHEWYRTDHTLVVDPKDPNTMYVNVEYKGLYKTTDGGKTWSQKTKGIKVYARSDDKTKGCYGEYPVLRMDPNDNKHLVLGVSGGGGGFLDATTPNSQTGGVYQSFDAGETWKLMINNKMNLYVTDVAIDPSDGKIVYYGTASNPASWQEADQTKLFVTQGLIYKTANQGKNWAELPTGIGSHSSVVRVMVNPTNTKEIVAPTYSALRQSADGTGTGVSTGKDTSVQQLGILKSSDGGASWTKLQLPGNPAISNAFVASTNFQHMFFVPQGLTKSVGYVTLNGGANFTATNNMDVVAYDPYDASGNHVLGYSTTAGTPTLPSLNLFESKDGGLTWRAYGRLPSEIKDLNDPKARPSALFWHPSDKNTLYMSGPSGYVWISTDAGQNWTKLLDYTKLS